MPCGCRWPIGVAGFLGAVRAVGVVRGRVWVDRAASAGAVWFPVTATPGPVSESASADHQRRCVVSGGLVVAFQLGEPVLGAPSGGVGGVDGDDRDYCVVSHLGQPVAQLCGREPGDHGPVTPSPPAAGWPISGVFAALLAGVGEVEVLDHYSFGVVFGRGGQDPADRRAQPPVASAGGQARQRQLDSARCAERIAVGGNNDHIQMGVVDVDGHHRMLAQFVQRRRNHRGAFPGGIQIPAARYWFMADVVAHRPSGRLGGDLITAIGEADRARQPVTAVRAVSQICQRCRKFDL